ncbi:hypothetical protein PR048_029095 [Dryococelus australis]|uniref:Uncharacterized protein n=1 Tax=Dryococelus australis TaxID=614101 RepID=A0ABQ9GCD7_9NEOP|nr:hypothetical protein PR048_029095 [Dryococelus australis]
MLLRYVMTGSLHWSPIREPTAYWFTSLVTKHRAYSLLVTKHRAYSLLVTNQRTYSLLVHFTGYQAQSLQLTGSFHWLPSTKPTAYWLPSIEPTAYWSPIREPTAYWFTSLVTKHKAYSLLITKHRVYSSLVGRTTAVTDSLPSVFKPVFKFLDDVVTSTSFLQRCFGISLAMFWNPIGEMAINDSHLQRRKISVAPSMFFCTWFHAKDVARGKTWKVDTKCYPSLRVPSTEPIWAALNEVSNEGEMRWEWSSAGMQKRGKRENPPRNPADERHRPARFPLAKIRE